MENVSLSSTMTIGIAACSAEGAALCYRTICAEAPTIMGAHSHPEIVMHTPPLSKYVDALEQGDIEEVARLMSYSEGRLRAADADFVICPDNTIHSAIHLLSGKTSLPWLNIADVVSRFASQHGMKRVGLLGTKWLVQSDVYPTALSKVGIEAVRPEKEAINDVSRMIMDELVLDLHNEASTQRLLSIIDDFKAKECDGVILGCTELPIVIDDTNSTLPTLDSTRLLAREALSYALGDNQ